MTTNVLVTIERLDSGALSAAPTKRSDEVDATFAFDMADDKFKFIGLFIRSAIDQTKCSDWATFDSTIQASFDSIGNP